LKKLVAINLLVVAALLVVPSMILEIYLRATVPASSGGSLYEYTLDTRRYKLMRANTAVTAFGKELRTNELGFRDRAIAPKQPGEFRIAVLGDSFTVSAGVEQEAIFTSLLEKRLERTRIINLAVGGYNIVQYALVLQEVGLALQPDLVLVALFPDNDFTNETYDANRLVASGQAGAEPAQAWYESLYIHRAYGTRLQTKLNALFGTKNPSSQKAGGWEQNTAALKAIAVMAREHGIALEVVLLPHTWNFEKQRPLFARVQNECAALGLACRDLLERFIARGVAEASLRLNALDAHPNERYNAVVAEELADLLSRRSQLVRTGG
jgi:hypothetical protein